MKELMKSLRWIALGSMVLLVLALMGCGGGDSRETRTAQATLTGAQEVPLTNSTATGSATVFVVHDARALDVTLDVSGIDLATVTAAHIHAGRTGEDGPVIFPLFTGPTGTFTSPFTVHLTEANLIRTTSGTESPSRVRVRSFSDFVHELDRGNLYINVHTLAFPDGEIRGQLRVINVDED
ncbi:MAG TPA: CHRD domain-containing protein [Armatimonadota bacterium]